MKITGTKEYKPTDEQIDLVKQRFEKIKGLLKGPVSFSARIGNGNFSFTLKTTFIKFKVCEKGDKVEQNVVNAFANLETYLSSQTKIIASEDDEKEWNIRLFYEIYLEI